MAASWPAGVTKDGFEIQFGTNHVGHALFTELLLPVLLKTTQLPDADVRISNVSSRGHEFTKGLLLENANTDMASFSTWTRYGHSKVSNVCFTQELAKLYPTIQSVSLHPGDVGTKWASVSPDVQNGMYYDPVGKIGSVSAPVKDESNAPALWEWTEAELGKRGF